MDNITYSEGPDDRYFNLRINKDLNNKTLNCEVKTNFSASAESGVYQMKLICKYYSTFLIFLLSICKCNTVIISTTIKIIQ